MLLQVGLLIGGLRSERAGLNASSVKMCFCVYICFLESIWGMKIVLTGETKSFLNSQLKKTTKTGP